MSFVALLYLFWKVQMAFCVTPPLDASAIMVNQTLFLWFLCCSCAELCFIFILMLFRTVLHTQFASWLNLKGSTCSFGGDANCHWFLLHHLKVHWLSLLHSHTLFSCFFTSHYKQKYHFKQSFWLCTGFVLDGSIKTAIFEDIALFEECNHTTFIAFPPRKCYQWLLVTQGDCLGLTFGSISKRAVKEKFMKNMPILCILPLECIHVTMHWSIECPQQSTTCYHEY